MDGDGRRLFDHVAARGADDGANAALGGDVAEFVHEKVQAALNSRLR